MGSEMQVFQTHTADGGLIFFTCPRNMTSADVDDLEEYLALIIRMKRRTLAAKPAPEAPNAKD